jgi:hypothetical protein
MRRFLLIAVMCVLAAQMLAAQVGVSVDVAKPGFYGRIDIGNARQPQVIYAEPVVIEQVPTVRQPVYMRVPPDEAKAWRKYCRKYKACGQPVYFVQETWYENVYVPQYRSSNAPSPVIYAHDIHSDVVRANVIRAHAVHATDIRARVVQMPKGAPVDGRGGEDIHAPVVSAGEIQAHDIHAKVIEADTIYVEKRPH